MKKCISLFSRKKERKGLSNGHPSRLIKTDVLFQKVTAVLFFLFLVKYFLFLNKPILNLILLSNITVIIFWFLITALFFLIVLMLWTNAKGAPWLPTPRKKVIRMLQMANVKPEDTVLDLGCGDGRVLVAAARRFKAKAIGIEIDPLKAFWCKILITFLGLRKQVKVICGNFFKEDISVATVVFCYLLQSTNNKLEEKLIQELSPETRVVTNTFIFHSLVLVKIDDATRSYLYYVGTEPEKT